MKFLLLILGLVSTTVHSNDWYIGKWEVVGAIFPGVSSIGKAEAQLWFGDIAVYTESKIEFKDHSCLAPDYEVEDITKDKFYSYYRVSFQHLEVSGLSTQIVNVKCKNGSSIASSGLIKVNNGFAYKLWNGVFFKLKYVQ